VQASKSLAASGVAYRYPCFIQRIEFGGLFADRLPFGTSSTARKSKRRKFSPDIPIFALAECVKPLVRKRFAHRRSALSRFAFLWSEALCVPISGLSENHQIEHKKSFTHPWVAGTSPALSLASIALQAASKRLPRIPR